MKKYFLSGVLLLFVFCASAQSLFEKDSILNKVRDSLPKGWTIQHNDLLLIISRVKPIYKTPANHINEPLDIHKDNRISTDDDPIPANGRKDTLKFVFRMLPRWSEQKYKSTEKYNDTLMAKIVKLEKQYKSGGTRYINKGTEKVKGDSAVDAYNNKIQEKVVALEKQIVNIPNYCTQHYFLVYLKENIIRNSDNDPRFYDIFPKQAEIDMQKINTLIDKWCNAYSAYHKGE